MNIEMLKALYEETTAELKKLKIPISDKIISVSINKRAKKRFGCCKMEKTARGEVYKIEISEAAFLMDKIKIKEIIAHELLHTCAGCMNHGEKWKGYAQKVNQAYGYNIKRVEKSENQFPQEDIKERWKYMIVCQKCGAAFGRLKRSAVVDNPQNYRCSKCGGKLKIYEKSTTSCR